MKLSQICLCAALSLVSAGLSVALPNERENEDAIVSHIRREHVASSAIAAIGYSRKLHALEIEFVNGAVYRYCDVPIALYRDLMAADSKARFYDKKIRARYRSFHVKSRKKK